MIFIVTFLEGILTFISPCLLPLLPVYIAYFTGASNDMLAEGETQKSVDRHTLLCALGFVLGFTLIFVAMGAFAGSIGSLLVKYQTITNIVCGAIVVFFGLYFMGVLHIGFLDRTVRPQLRIRPRDFFSAFLFGIIFAFGWTPCVGAFLGSALLLASQQASALTGIALLLTYSAGLGIPFLLTALLIERIGGAFDLIKRHYRVITIVCGILLIIVGILMMFGITNNWLSMLSTL